MGVVIIAAGLLCACGRPVSDFPHWKVESRTQVECVDDVEIMPWFVVSGKQGAGLVLQFRENSWEQEVEQEQEEVWEVGQFRQRSVDISSAVIYLRHVDAAEDWVDQIVEGRRTAPVRFEGRGSVYVPFYFDNEDAWNEGLRRGRLEVELYFDHQLIRLSYPITHENARWVRYSRERGDYEGEFIPMDILTDGGCVGSEP